MLDQLDHMLEQAQKALENSRDLAELDEWRVRYFGKKSELTEIFKEIGKLPGDERPLAGKRANEVKTALERAYEERVEVLKGLQRDALLQERFDVTLPGRPIDVGRLHISTQTLRNIYGIFAKMGFQVFEAPEVETELNNFELLNMPPGHPARDMWDTFYTTREGILLRSHTSPGQIRAMRKYCPNPIRVILPGKCYRYEQVSSRSDFMFYQVEGLALGRRITLADLKGSMIEFSRLMFGADREVRFRCSYFPFTEPSVEVDIDCILCGGKGCSVCKQTGWLEILGAGMVHPVVLENGGYDPGTFSGYAFGMGPERIAMLRYRINDIRYFFSNDLRFLRQF
ncbi:MAG: phenylalanine--tRNA ligase subunit alpha [Syntrophobacterales bacterium]|nr:MAG: phenylalanine--tRNA ligase subunit alpha [Syntrophobacterales bacterium]